MVLCITKPQTEYYFYYFLLIQSVYNYQPIRCVTQNQSFLSLNNIHILNDTMHKGIEFHITFHAWLNTQRIVCGVKFCIVCLFDDGLFLVMGTTWLILKRTIFLAPKETIGTNLLRSYTNKNSNKRNMQNECFVCVH